MEESSAAETVKVGRPAVAAAVAVMAPFQTLEPEQEPVVFPLNDNVP